MNYTSGTISVVAPAPFQALDPIEKIVIRAQTERGEVRIISEGSDT